MCHFGLERLDNEKYIFVHILCCTAQCGTRSQPRSRGRSTGAGNHSCPYRTDYPPSNRNHYWSLAWRVHYVLVTVASVAFLWFLVNWNLLAV